jgi:hypothetical protein
VGGAVVTVCVAVAAFVTVGLAVTTGAFVMRLLVAAGVDDDEEPAAAAMPMMNRRPQNPSKAVSTLCLAGQGLRPLGPPGGPYSTCVGGFGGG